jgi:BirA family biotin operon repressor/biotin-[acetyl-CoA-carboxylase] ligase
MEFNTIALRSRLAGKTIGHPLHYFETLDSTNRVALSLAREGVSEGTVVISDEQTAGRGRLKRVWQSPPGCNLYTSVILRPTVALSEISQITLLAGVAVAETLASICPEGVTIKWPNDIMIRDRKVCGILTESVEAGGSLAVIVGIGGNVNIGKDDFDPAYRDTATSLLEETGREHSREELAFLLFGRLEAWYKDLQETGFTEVRKAWLSRSEMMGKRIRIGFRDEVHEGTVQGIDHNGVLLISDEQGEILRITAGDATILKE